MVMKNPLRKRILRELRTEWVKYVIIFCFMVVMIGFESGEMIGADSMSWSIQTFWKDNNLENGHFHLGKKASDDLIREIEKEDVTIYPDFYIEETYRGLKANNGSKKETVDKTVRIYAPRETVNKVQIRSGKEPEKDDEIAIDRMYADNNDLEIGDSLELGGKTYRICGLSAFPDYTSLFQSESDMMFDSANFTVAVVTQDAFDALDQNKITYNYAWTYDKGDPGDDMQEKEWSDNLSEAIVKAVSKDNGINEVAVMLGAVTLENAVDELTPAYTNNAIHFAPDDLSGDRGMMMALLVILIAVLAFIFGVTTGHTIDREATVIGTLRASGYTRREMMIQYTTLPLLVTLAASVVGNILGYTKFKDMITDLYYGSYSMPDCHVRFNPDAFIYTTVVPVILMMGIVCITLHNKLKISPLRFLRHDLEKRKREKAVRLNTKIPFMTRFRLRIILQNVSSYLALFFGIFVSGSLLLFGLMFGPLLDDLSQVSIDAMPAPYQYMLRDEAETSTEGAEKFAVSTMDTYVTGYAKEACTVYGLYPNSKYIKEKMPDKGVYISTGVQQKYRLNPGDTILLKEQFSNKLIEFTIRGTVDASTTIGVYMDHDYYCDVFGLDKDYYSGYFSEKKITDISSRRIYNVITEKDMVKMAEQLKISMGGMFVYVQAFSILLFAMVVYLLTKIILEKNAHCISLCKILGYQDGEIGRLYLLATGWIVLLSTLVCFVLITGLLDVVFASFMKTYSGWIPFSLSTSTYIKAYVMTIVAFLVVGVVQMFRIRKIPMDQALKTVE